MGCRNFIAGPSLCTLVGKQQRKGSGPPNTSGGTPEVEASISQVLDRLPPISNVLSLLILLRKGLPAGNVQKALVHRHGVTLPIQA